MSEAVEYINHFVLPVTVDHVRDARDPVPVCKALGLIEVFAVAAHERDGRTSHDNVDRTTSVDVPVPITDGESGRAGGNVELIAHG